MYKIKWEYLFIKEKQDMQHWQVSLELLISYYDILKNQG